MANHDDETTRTRWRAGRIVEGDDRLRIDVWLNAAWPARLLRLLVAIGGCAFFGVIAAGSLGLLEERANRIHWGGFIACVVGILATMFSLLAWWRHRVVIYVSHESVLATQAPAIFAWFLKSIVLSTAEVDQVYVELDERDVFVYDSANAPGGYNVVSRHALKGYGRHYKAKLRQVFVRVQKADGRSVRLCTIPMRADAALHAAAVIEQTIERFLKIDDRRVKGEYALRKGRSTPDGSTNDQSRRRTAKQAMRQLLIPVLFLMIPAAVAVNWFVSGRHVEADAADLLDALKDDDPNVRADAAAAISSITPIPQRAARALIAALHDDDIRVRLAAASGLGRMGAAAVTPLVDALQDKDPAVRKLAARALGQIGPTAEVAVPALREVLKDEDDRIRDEAVLALNRIQHD